MNSADGLNLALRVFMDEAMEEVDAAVDMGMEAKPAAEFYMYANEVRASVNRMIIARNVVLEEFDKWKKAEEWEVRLNRLKAMRMGLLKESSIS